MEGLKVYFINNKKGLPAQISKNVFAIKRASIIYSDPEPVIFEAILKEVKPTSMVIIGG